MSVLADGGCVEGSSRSVYPTSFQYSCLAGLWSSHADTHHTLCRGGVLAKHDPRRESGQPLECGSLLHLRVRYGGIEAAQRPRRKTRVVDSLTSSERIRVNGKDGRVRVLFARTRHLALVLALLASTTATADALFSSENNGLCSLYAFLPFTLG
jgi:hypothetical protein